LRLDTDDGVPAALAAFRFASFPPIDDYSGDPYARRLRAGLVDDLRAKGAMHLRLSVMRREYRLAKATRPW
jgi:hypothetical protein